MLGWIFFATTLALAIIYAVTQRSANKRELDDLKALQRQRLGEADERLAHANEEHQKHLARIKRELERAKQRAHLPLAKDLLPGIDALEQAILSAKKTPGASDIVDGLEMVQNELTRGLARHDITPISPSRGEDAFDPSIHEAVAVIVDEELPNHSVHTLLRAGWQHSTGVMRPAMVQTAKSSRPAIEPERPSDPEEEGEDDVAFDFDEQGGAQQDHSVNEEEAREVEHTIA